jgi:guanylate kinase
MPKIKINKRPGDEVAFYHTHPSKDEPSLTSADDIQWYLDASFSTGVKRHYTIMRDRIDRFTFKVKNNRVEKYLGFDEEKFIADIDAMLEAGEAEAKKDKGMDDVEFCRIITQHMVDLFNKKYGSIATISYKQFVNPNYTPPKEVPKGDEDPFEVRANPGPVSSKIRPPSRLYHTALEELSGLDYDYVHYGGDEYAHTMFCYFWLSHHLEPTKQFPSGRMFKWEDIGFDSDLRKKVRAYLNENIASNYSMLDLVYILALYHDAGKNIQKDSGNEIHHSKGAQMMWDSFISGDLDIPEPLDDIVSVMLESDIGRRNISEDFFRTQVGPYYGAALLMLMADIATHHPFMWTGMAQEFKSAGHYDGKVNGADFKNWYLRQHVEKLRTFLNEPRQNPRPLVASVKYRWNYGVQDISAALMEAAFEPYLRHNVDPSKEYWYPTNKTSGNGYLILNTTNAPELGDVIPDGYDLNVRASNGTGNFDLTFRKDFPNLNMNLGREAVNAVYLTLGRALQDIEDIELEDPEQAAVPVVAVNPRKASRVRLISISGPAGVGKSTSIRLLKKKFPGVGEVLAYTTRPPRPKERDGVDKHFVSKAKFMEMIQNDEFLEYRRMKNGHLYGRRFADFKYPINVIDVNIGGMKKYKDLFPDMFSIYLRPKNRSTSALEAMLLERGGMSKKEAKERALLMPAQIARASKEDFDLFIDMETGNYRKNFLSRIDEIPLENPAVPVGEVMQEVPERLPRQATFGQGLAPENDAERNYRELRRRIISFNNMAESGEYSAFAIPSYFDDSYLPEGTIRSPVENRTHVLVPNAQAERFSALLDSSALPMGNPPEGIRLKDVVMTKNYDTIIRLIERRLRGDVPKNWDPSKASEAKKKRVAEKKRKFRKELAKWGYTGNSAANAAEHIFQDHVRRFKGDRVKVYRAMFVTESPEVLDQLWEEFGVGVFWANEKDGADQFGGVHGSGFRYHPSSRVAFLTGYVRFSDVNWFGTVHANLMFGKKEKEVRMYADSQIEVEKVDFYKVTQRARQKYVGEQGMGGRYMKPWTDPAIKPDFTWEAGKSYYGEIEPVEEDLEEEGYIVNPQKELFEWFEEWVHLINMKNKELKAFLDSPLGKKAGLSKEEADAQGIKSGRVSGRRILKMRAKLGLTGPKDYIKIGPRIIENYYEKALKEWTGPSDDPLDGETDWDWCKRQVRFVKRHGAFPYNADQKGPLVREQKTQNQVSRRLLGLWVWGHDPWRWARKHDITRMPPCPDVPWIGMTEKRKYGKVEVKMNPPTVFHGSSVAPEDMDGDFLMPGVSDDPDRASDEPIVSFTTWDTFAAYFAFVGRGLSEAQGTAKWPGGEDKIIVKADRPLLRKGYIYVADAKDIPGLQQHPERPFEYFTTEPVPLSIFEVYDLRREDWPQIVENPWFPSDVSYPSALTAQTISITQLSNLPRPNPRTPGGRKIPSKYLKGLTPVEKAIAEYEIDQGYKYDVDDPKAYEFWKSDIKATARGMKTTPSKYRTKFARLYGPLKGKGSFLTRMSKTTGVDKAILEKVYDKGLAAWRTGHRPGVQQHQWASGRVYSFVTLGNTVMKDGKKMGDYSLAVEAGLIKENSSRHDWVEEDEDEFLNMFEW